jgi:hypothetical protein
MTGGMTNAGFGVSFGTTISADAGFFDFIPKQTQAIIPPPKNTKTPAPTPIMRPILELDEEVSGTGVVKGGAAVTGAAAVV